MSNTSSFALFCIRSLTWAAFSNGASCRSTCCIAIDSISTGVIIVLPNLISNCCNTSSTFFSILDGNLVGVQLGSNMYIASFGTIRPVASCPDFAPPALPRPPPARCDAKSLPKNSSYLVAFETCLVSRLHRQSENAWNQRTVSTTGSA